MGKKQLKILVLSSVMFALYGCAPQEAANSGVVSDGCAERALKANPRDYVFVSRSYSGGKQCDGIASQRPDADQILRDHCVVVFESSYESLPVCMACDVCPDYAFRHCARIWGRDLIAAEDLGYTLDRSAQ